MFDKVYTKSNSKDLTFKLIFQSFIQKYFTFRFNLNFQDMAVKKYKFYVINIKLQSDRTEEERFEAYDQFIRDLTDTPQFTRLNANSAITMYKPFVREENEIKYYYGRLGKGISFFDLREITVLNNNSVSTETVDRDRILMPRIGQYIYIPSIHRFALLKEPDAVTIGDFERFLREHLVKYILPEEKIEIDFEKEPSIIDEIFQAEAVYKLSYEISYTNSDALDAQGEFFDELLKDNNIGKLTVTATSDHHVEGMKVENVNFLGGGIQVARNNGVIRSARIKRTDENRIITINNRDKPLVEELEVQNQEDNTNIRWFQRLRNLYAR